MIIIHTFLRCIHCDKKLEITDQAVALGDVECDSCGYTNELTDSRLEIWEEEF